jgi:hypothetical protein
VTQKLTKGSRISFKREKKDKTKKGREKNVGEYEN